MRAMRLHDRRSNRRRARTPCRHRRRRRRGGNCSSRRRSTGPSGHEHPAQVGAWKRLAIRQCGVDARVAPRAFAHDFRKEPELTHGAAAFAGEPIERQSGFAMRAFQQVVAEREDFLRDLLQEPGAHFRARAAVSGKGVVCEHERALDLRQRTLVKRRFKPLTVERTDGVEVSGAGFDEDAGDEAFSV